MFGVAGILVVGLVSVVLARLKPAAPTVERATVWVDTVKRGPMVRQVRGLGTLVPVDEARRWVPASTQGRVEKIILRPGVQVTPDTVVLELSDPQVQQALNDAEQQLRARRSRLQQPEGPARCRDAQPARAGRHRRGRLPERADRTRDERRPRQGRPGLEPDPASSRWSAPNRSRRATSIEDGALEGVRSQRPRAAAVGAGH